MIVDGSTGFTVIGNTAAGGRTAEVDDSSRQGLHQTPTVLRDPPRAGCPGKHEMTVMCHIGCGLSGDLACLRSRRSCRRWDWTPSLSPQPSVLRTRSGKDRLRVSTLFVGFEAGMPLIGWGCEHRWRTRSAASPTNWPPGIGDAGNCRTLPTCFCHHEGRHSATTAAEQ